MKPGTDDTYTFGDLDQRVTAVWTSKVASGDWQGTTTAPLEFEVGKVGTGIEHSGTLSDIGNIFFKAPESVAGDYGFSPRMHLLTDGALDADQKLGAIEFSGQDANGDYTGYGAIAGFVRNANKDGDEVTGSIGISGKRIDPGSSLSRYHSSLPRTWSLFITDGVIMTNEPLLVAPYRVAAIGDGYDAEDFDFLVTNSYQRETRAGVWGLTGTGMYEEVLFDLRTFHTGSRVRQAWKYDNRTEVTSAENIVNEWYLGIDDWTSGGDWILSQNDDLSSPLFEIDKNATQMKFNIPIRVVGATEYVEVVDAGSTGASGSGTITDWVQVSVNGTTGYIKVYDAK